VFVSKDWKSCNIFKCFDFFHARMASTSSHNNIPLSTLLEWYKIRDTFFGNNCVDQNIPLALEMASSCQHPDARWLTEACAGKDVNTREDAKRVFSALGQNDARALCFTWLCGKAHERQELFLVHRSAGLGFAFAQALMAGRTQGLKRRKFAELGAPQGERDCFFWLGVSFFRDRVGCEKDLCKAREYFLRASELGAVAAMSNLGDLLEDSDAQKWRWWGRQKLLDTIGVLCPNLGNKSNCSTLALEVLLSCLRSDKLCKDV
jgi:hypothetical protein